MAEDDNRKAFPGGLVEWSGHRSGGVRRMFDTGSGRPGGEIVSTSLIARLLQWAEDLVRAEQVPSVVLLVGGPGNGKTEAVEVALEHIDALLGKGGALVRSFARELAPAAGTAVPRLVPIEITAGAGKLSLAVVQDASVKDSARPSKAAAELLLEELALFAQPGAGVYLACVNRGVLDDALILASEKGLDSTRILLESIARAVALTPDAPSCWPLHEHPQIGVWPMDAESLLFQIGDGGSAADKILDLATKPEAWPTYGECPAGLRCPFCYSRKSITAGARGRTALLDILRFCELGTGKRWTFRDLFSLVPQLLAHVPDTNAGPLAASPCDWAARMLEIDKGSMPATSDRARSTAIFFVASATYQHVLFGEWDRAAVKQIQADIKELGLEKDRTLQGLCTFVRSNKRVGVPATLKPLLADICKLLDPALATPESQIQLARDRALSLGELDARFSHSVESGLEFLIKSRCLSSLEKELLERISDCEKNIADLELRSSRTVAARRLQRALRDFACRWARRSLGGVHGAVRDRESFQTFRIIVDSPDGNQELLHLAARKVEALLNTNGRFEISLNTTFGEPLPPPARRATLIAEKQRVRPRQAVVLGRPRPPLAFLTIGSAKSAQPIPLTYDLYKAVSDLGQGLMQSALPSTVVALLDSTRARLAGALVRDKHLLDDAEIRIGSAREVVAIGPQGFAMILAGEQ
ncbi:MAG: hypothetical protein V4864_07205 [Pseudomonadota bacterium]